MGTRGEMAEGGGFGVRSEAMAASPPRDGQTRGPIVSCSGKSTRPLKSVNDQYQETNVAVKSPKSRIHFLNIVRIVALTDVEAFSTLPVPVGKLAMCASRVTHLLRWIDIMGPEIRPRAEGKPSAKGKRGLLI